jgi:predicted nuclease of predicted toxin-antitoxin system
MNLLADESVQGPIVKRLRQDGHNVLYVSEMEAGIPDETVLQRGNEQDALLLTGDKDFGDLVYRQKLIWRGVVLMRLEGLSNEAKAQIVARALADHGEMMEFSFSVISLGAVRVRRRQN